MSDDWGDYDPAAAAEAPANAAGGGTGYGAVLAALEDAQRLLASGEDPSAQLEQLAATVRASAAEEAAATERPLYFTQLDHFVEQYLVRIYRRDLERPGTRWCSEWWRYAEAIARLEAMWRAWEQLRWEPGQGGSTWWLMHADPHMRVLLSDEGPFRHCKNGQAPKEDRVGDLPTTPAPHGMFAPRD